MGRYLIFSFLFFSFYLLDTSSRSPGAREECSEGLKAPDLQVGELRGYRRSRCYPLCLYSLGCPFSFLFNFECYVTELHDFFVENEISIRYMQMACILQVLKINNLNTEINNGCYILMHQMHYHYVILSYSRTSNLIAQYMLILINQSEIAIIYIRNICVARERMSILAT